ncbi:fimbrial protein [Buttiauxella ferragutiae]|uniref:fimbrial protein n=1 Tax=Buttiauxella ferragutiae TaxID=82989 RepID=UPI0035258C02
MKFFSGALCIAGLMLTTVVHASTPMEFNSTPMEFKGVLWDAPCSVAPESQSQTVSFEEQELMAFQEAPGRGDVENFSVRLNNCSLSSALKVVKIIFEGVRENNMGADADYWLKMGTGPNVGLLAVGILDANGNPVKLGDVSNQGGGTPIDNTSLILNFQAVVQATPAALAAKSVVPGSYSSQANFTLSYE